MSESDSHHYDDDDEDRTISLDDLESMENEQANQVDSNVDEDDWGDAYDDLDSEAWERQYRQEDEEVERDPWELG